MAAPHVWMAPAWQEIIWRAAQRSLAVMCPACSRSPDGLLALMESANRGLITRAGCTGENFGDIGHGALILKRPVMTVAHQAALLDVFARLVHHRQAIFGGEVDKLGALGGRKKRASAQQSALRSFRDRLKHRCACRFRSGQIDIDEI